LTKFSTLKLKAAVKGLAAKGRAAQREISHLRQTRPPKGQLGGRELHGISIQGAVAQKRSYGHCARYHQLVYAFVRGMPYRRVELRTRQGNKPSPHILLEVLIDFAEDPGLEHVVASIVHSRDVPASVAMYLAELEAWLALPATSAASASTASAA
jgi:hypothetical protein